MRVSFCPWIMTAFISILTSCHAAALPLEGSSSTLTSRDGSEMAAIPAGKFLMGSSWISGKDDEHPQHKVFLKSFIIGKYDVTNDQFAAFLNAYGKADDESRHPMIFQSDYGLQKAGRGQWKSMEGFEKNPAINVTWYGARQYCKYYGMRLPTEAEWEKAARAVSDAIYSFGNDKSMLGDYAWTSENSRGVTQPVGEKKPNDWGLYDMQGNVWQWCSDWYDENYYKNSPASNPKGPKKGSGRVVRGGSWEVDPSGCRPSIRNWYDPANGFNVIGFRCACSSLKPK